MNRYDLIYADPPWSYRDKQNHTKAGAAHHYRTMTLVDMMRLNVKAISNPSCLLAMWYTGPMGEDAALLANSWGFDVRTMTGFTWVKTTKAGRRAFGLGSWTRGNAENVLFAVRGKPKRANAGISQLVEAVNEGHSIKPEAVAERLVAMMRPHDDAGQWRALELFARRRREGPWDFYGDQVDGSIDLPPPMSEFRSEVAIEMRRKTKQWLLKEG